MSRLHYINSLWTLEFEYANPSPSLDDRKKVFAYKKFKEDFSNFEYRGDQKRAIEREAVSEIYQLIGFDSVFQAVWFQAVVALAQTHVNCRASVLLVIASVLVSLATIVGVYHRFEKIYKAKDGYRKDKLHLSVVERHIKLFEKKGLGVDWDEIKLSDPSPNLDNELRQGDGATLAMGRLSTTIINNSGSMMIIKEGTHGVYRNVTTLANGKHFIVTVDPNSTYREYLLRIEPDFEFILTSDDSYDNASVTVISVNGRFEVKTTPREPKSSAPAPGKSFVDKAGRWLRKLWRGDPDI